MDMQVQGMTSKVVEQFNIQNMNNIIKSGILHFSKSNYVTNIQISFIFKSTHWEQLENFMKIKNTRNKTNLRE